MCCNDKFLEHLNALNGLYEKLNELFFENTLTKPVITIQRDVKGKSLGWFTPRESWQAEKETSTEINITANFLDRTVKEIASTMLHEMCHLYAYMHKIQDCSRSNIYHNKEFKKIAESHGLKVQKVDKIGWSHTEFDELAYKKIEPFLSTLASLRRIPELKIAKKASSTRKYICSSCGMSVRATKQVNIICADCDEVMKEE